MTSNNPFSAFQQFNDMCNSFVFVMSTKRVTVVEYARRGGIYTHSDGRLDGGLHHDYIVGMEMLNFRLHVGNEIGWDGFPARHELVSFRLMNEGGDPPTFESTADGSIGILHGFRREGWPVDIIFHAVLR